MQAIVNTGPGRLEWQDVPLPQPQAGQVRVRTGAVGICATDLEMIAGWERTGFPAIPGHEWCGTVDAAGGGVDPALVGQRCVAENVWADGGEVGFEHSGGYGRYFVTEASKLELLPPDFPPAAGVLIEPLAVCVRALQRLGGAGALTRPPAGPILVVGDGTIGLLLTLLLARGGATDVTVVGGREGRLAVARELGARQTVNYHLLGEALAGGIRQAAGDRFHTLIEASGSARAMSAALDLAGHDASVIALGDYSRGQADFRWNLLLHKELRLIGSNASAGAWPDAVRVALSERSRLAALISRRFPAARFEDAFSLVRNRAAGVVKVVLEWD